MAKLTTRQGEVVRRAILKKIGPATQKADILELLQRERPQLSRPTLDRWCNWLEQLDPVWNTARLMMCMDPRLRNSKGEAVKLHPYQANLLLALFIWQLPEQRLNLKRCQEFLETNPVKYTQYEDLVRFQNLIDAH